jgi:hypothetical protein
MASKSGESENLIDLGIPTSPPPAYSTPQSTTEPNSASGTPLPVRPRGPRPPLPLDLPALASLKGKRVVLASASPRRRQLLAQVTIPVPPMYDEFLASTNNFSRIHPTASFEYYTSIYLLLFSISELTRP